MSAPDCPAARPVVWSIAGNDSIGGAGLGADQRAANAFGVHLCPVVAAVTAQNSRAVTRLEPVPADWLQAQLDALADDAPPLAIKTGLLGSAANVAAVARCVDCLRTQAPVALVVDPVFAATTGRAFAAQDVVRAYRELLLPRATLITPNDGEAARLLDQESVTADAPALAEGLRAAGASAVAITGGDRAGAAWALDWIAAPHASGWLALPRVATSHTHGTGCTFATAAACGLARGFVTADALVLAKMATARALQTAYAAGKGAGPVGPSVGFSTRADLMPALSWGAEAGFVERLRAALGPGPVSEDIGLYGIVDSTERVRAVLAAGVKTVQLRMKAPAAPDAEWPAALRQALSGALAACAQADATLVVNDHWRLALDLAAAGGDGGHLALHLGQEDLGALDAVARNNLARGRVRLGVSSHSLWELARARSMAPWYIACGPVWPTLTKAMPWRAQGLDNLAWWVRMAGAPVVAIGGILEAEKAEAAARTGAASVCVVRGLGARPADTVPRWQAALAAGRKAERLPVPAFPHPTLASATAA